MTRTTIAAGLLGAVLALTLTGCGGASTDQPEPLPSSAAAESLEGSITVFAAASLRGTFTELTEEFEAANPGTTVELNFAGSSDLVTQITEGAPADVFASADQKNMGKLTEEELIDSRAPVDFATNVLTIAVPPSNPAAVEAFTDLEDPAVRTVVCAPQVPCGAATVAVEEAAGVDIPAVSEESSVTDVLGKVTSGEADAGLVYVTDVIGAGDTVQGIDFPESGEAVNTYPIAPVSASENPAVAEAFVAFVTGDTAADVLEAAGFGSP